MSHYRILHVEDSPDDSELVRMALGKAPFTISYTRVETEPDYVAQLESLSPDIILCDYDLPRFSAERALQIMIERGVDIPFIVVSHHIDESAAVIAMQQGASDYLPKRNLRRLAKAMESAVDRRNIRMERAKAQEALRASESMKRSILNSLLARIATVDAHGVILAANKAWTDFAETRDQVGFRAAEVGDNYFELLRHSRSSTAAAILQGIQAVIARERSFFSLDYYLNIGRDTRWYHARAVPLEGSEDGAVVSHRDITDRMLAHVALEQASQRMQALSKRVLNVQEEERRALSRELHDDIGQCLAALKIGLLRISPERGADEKSLLGECLGMADLVLDKVRRIALDLRPPQLDQLGLADALEWLVEHQRSATGLRIELACSGFETRRAPPALENACYRIAQEAINNASRHAKAKVIRVRLESNGRLLKLAVHDDGVGFDEAMARDRARKTGSLGLTSMEERAQLAGGRLRIRSVMGSGTNLSAIFPLGPDADEASQDAGIAAQ